MPKTHRQAPLRLSCQADTDNGDVDSDLSAVSECCINQSAGNRPLNASIAVPFHDSNFTFEVRQCKSCPFMVLVSV